MLKRFLVYGEDMAKFFTYEELREHFPTKERVSETRDLVIEFIQKNLSYFAVVYGSSAWGLHKRFEDSHTRRSDVDVALSSSWKDSKFYICPYDPVQDERLTEFCSKTSQKMHVPIEVITVGGKSEDYQALINPSTADHFRLLGQKFPKKSYKKFKSTMEVKFHQRIEDLSSYLGDMKDHHSYLKNRPKDDLESYLEELSKLENFPDHLIRKILGHEKILPCPDSKANVREAFRNFSHAWPIKDKLLPLFEKIFSFSDEYESLIDDVKKGLSADSYYEKLKQIAQANIHVSGEIFQTLSGDFSHLMNVTKIPKGTPALILTHYKTGGGTVNVQRLDSDFGNVKEGVTYISYYRTPEELGIKDRTLFYITEKGIPIYGGERNLNWIKDPLDQKKGWFNYKSGTWYYSIKPCDEETLTKLKEELNLDSPEHDRSKKKYYKRFVKEALNPDYSNVPARLKGRINK